MTSSAAQHCRSGEDQSKRECVDGNKIAKVFTTSIHRGNVQRFVQVVPERHLLFRLPRALILFSTRLFVSIWLKNEE